MILVEGLNLLTQQFLNLPGGTLQIGVLTVYALSWERYFALGIVLYAESAVPLSASNPNSVLDLGVVTYRSNLLRIPTLFSGTLYRGLLIDAFDSGVGLDMNASIFRNP